MPRSIWSGAISFGLVTVPVHVVSATEDQSVRFHQYHLDDMARVRVRKFCELEDREVRSDEIGKGYELTKTQVIPLTDQELRNLPLPTAKALEIHGFVPLESVDVIRIGEGYYLQPDGPVAAKPYELLRQALERSSRVAVTKFAWSGRERLGLLRVRENTIVLHAMRWPDEVRDPSELYPPAADVSDAEVGEAVALIERMTTDRLEARTSPTTTPRRWRRSTTRVRGQTARERASLRVEAPQQNESRPGSSGRSLAGIVLRASCWARVLGQVGCSPSLR
ncbi:Ku protein [Streptomyces sp. NPDC001507]|uniref:non-homologous end joining protein Ku n=1 Tax=Streptomyces sp. NPDC001507 TaxID=3364579 RepID=UPI0036CF9673